jgi:hypothetical protein
VRELRTAATKLQDSLFDARSALASSADDNARLRHQLAGVTGMGAPSSQRPDWVMVGIPRPGVGVRIIASRQLSGTSFDMTAMEDPPPRWVIRAIMEQALFVDKSTYQIAIMEIGQIWANWDRQAAADTRARVVVRDEITPGQGELPPG